MSTELISKILLQKNARRGTKKSLSNSQKRLRGAMITFLEAEGCIYRSSDRLARKWDLVEEVVSGVSIGNCKG